MADGFVVGLGVAEAPTHNPEHAWILRGMTPLDCPVWAERDATWVCSEGLERTASLRDGWPGLRWLPRAEIYCPSVRYDFVAAAPGEGFSVYRPDTSTIQRHRVVDDAEDLHSWLARAKSLGFRTVWLECRNAAERGRGLDLVLLDRARRVFGGGRIWLSGGATEPRHLANLVAEGGAAAAVVSRAFAEQWGCATLLTALGRSECSDDTIQASATPPGAGAPSP
jgi:hypothetical protein